MTGAIDRKLYGYIERLNAAQKKSLLEFIKTILPDKETDIYTIEQYNKELEEADAAIDRGEFYTHKEAKEIFKKHLRDRK